MLIEVHAPLHERIHEYNKGSQELKKL